MNEVLNFPSNYNLLCVQYLTCWNSDNCIKNMRAYHIMSDEKNNLKGLNFFEQWYQNTWQISTNIHFPREVASRFPDSQMYYLHFYWFLYVIWKHSPSGLFRKPLYYCNRRFESRWGHICFSLVFVFCSVGSSLCDGLITRSEESYRLFVSLILCDLEMPQRGGFG